ncbi:hypothetical protein LI205_09805 [bacterium MSK18_59]|uniref:hypothetical protein n=1 Tax=Blautia sp. OM05-6 TaxID=2292983 RepID=UPI0013140F03|nr:hypothetical protein [Blautia sp. OM05-6]MCB6807992.1 hypothetical protein [bacterium MSK18_59]
MGKDWVLVWVKRNTQLFNEKFACCLKQKISGMMLLITNEIIGLHIDRNMSVQAYFYVNKKEAPVSSKERSVLLVILRFIFEFYHR